MIAHQKLQLPESLLPDDVSDLLARLGHRVDRRNVTRALEAAAIPGVVPPASRACRWVIPRRGLLSVVAAVLRRRDLRSAAATRSPLKPIEHYRLPAARLLLREPSLKPYVPLALRRRVAAEEGLRAEAALRRQQQRESAANAKAASAQWLQRQQDASLRELAMLSLYFEARQLATRTHFPVLDKTALESPAFEAFLVRWPYPNERPAWWLPPPGVLEQAVELLRPWAAGTIREPPKIAHLLADIDIDYRQPWRWRADA